MTTRLPNWIRPFLVGLPAKPKPAFRIRAWTRRIQKKDMRAMPVFEREDEVLRFLPKPVSIRRLKALARKLPSENGFHMLMRDEPNDVPVANLRIYWNVAMHAVLPRPEADAR